MRFRLALAAGVLIICGACKVDVGVAIDVNGDGAGKITATARLDQDAVEAIGDLDEQLDLDDLAQAGWDVQPPDLQHDGSAEIEVSRAFDSPAEASQIIEDVAGGAGPFKNFAVEQERGFFKTRTHVRGTVDLSGGLASFADPALSESLGEQPLGVTEAQLERRFGAPIDRMFGLQIAALLPGDSEDNAPTATADGGVWAPRFGEQLALRADAEQWNVRTLSLLVVGISSTVALAILLVVRMRRRGGEALAEAPDLDMLP